MHNAVNGRQEAADGQLVIFELDAQRLALPLVVVERIERAVAITPLANSPAMIAGVINVRGSLFPVIALRRCLDMPVRALTLSDQLILARGARRTYALLVDNVLDVAEYKTVDITAPEAFAAPDDSLRGALRRADGIVFIHDLERFLAVDEERALTQALESAQVRA